MLFSSYTRIVWSPYTRQLILPRASPIDVVHITHTFAISQPSFHYHLTHPETLAMGIPVLFRTLQTVAPEHLILVIHLDDGVTGISVTHIAIDLIELHLDRLQHVPLTITHDDRF